MAKRAFALEVPVRKCASMAAAVFVGLGLAAAGVALLAPWVFSAAALRAEISARIRT